MLSTGTLTKILSITGARNSPSYTLARFSKSANGTMPTRHIVYSHSGKSHP